MESIKFKEQGKWAESDTTLPQLVVEAGDVRRCSDDLARIIENAGKGKIVFDEVATENQENEEILLSEKTEANKDMQGKLSNAEKKITGLISDNASLSELNEELLNDCEKYEKTISENADVIANMESEIGNLKDELKAVKKSGKDKKKPGTEDKAKAESK